MELRADGLVESKACHRAFIYPDIPAGARTEASPRGEDVFAAAQVESGGIRGRPPGPGTAPLRTRNPTAARSP